MPCIAIPGCVVFLINLEIDEEFASSNWLPGWKKWVWTRCYRFLFRKLEFDRIWFRISIAINRNIYSNKNDSFVVKLFKRAQHKIQLQTPLRPLKGHSQYFFFITSLSLPLIMPAKTVSVTEMPNLHCLISTIRSVQPTPLWSDLALLTGYQSMSASSSSQSRYSSHIHSQWARFAWRHRFARWTNWTR